MLTTLVTLLRIILKHFSVKMSQENKIILYYQKTPQTVLKTKPLKLILQWNKQFKGYKTETRKKKIFSPLPRRLFHRKRYKGKTF